MTNDDQMYVRHLEQALEAAELEIKGLENEARERENLLVQMQEQLNPTHMGEPASCRKQIEELQSRIAMQDEVLRDFVDSELAAIKQKLEDTEAERAAAESRWLSERALNDALQRTVSGLQAERKERENQVKELKGEPK